MSDYNLEVGKRIKKQRLKQKLTLKELGEKVSLSEGNVQRYEVGKIKSVGINIVKSFAKALNTTPAYLMGWEEESISKENIDNKTVKKEEFNFLLARYKKTSDKDKKPLINAMENIVDTLFDEESEKDE